MNNIISPMQKNASALEQSSNSIPVKSHLTVSKSLAQSAQSVLLGMDDKNSNEIQDNSKHLVITHKTNKDLENNVNVLNNIINNELDFLESDMHNDISIMVDRLKIALEKCNDYNSFLDLSDLYKREIHAIGEKFKKEIIFKKEIEETIATLTYTLDSIDMILKKESTALNQNLNNDLLQMTKNIQSHKNYYENKLAILQKEDITLVDLYSTIYSNSALFHLCAHDLSGSIAHFQLALDCTCSIDGEIDTEMTQIMHNGLEQFSKTEFDFKDMIAFAQKEGDTVDVENINNLIKEYITSRQFGNTTVHIGITEDIKKDLRHNKTNKFPVSYLIGHYVMNFINNAHFKGHANNVLIDCYQDKDTCKILVRNDGDIIPQDKLAKLGKEEIQSISSGTFLKDSTNFLAKFNISLKVESSEGLNGPYTTCSSITIPLDPEKIKEFTDNKVA